jgi:hypothetical protein
MRTTTFGQRAHEIVGRGGEGRGEAFDRGALGRVGDAFRMHQRHRVDPDMFGDDEFHASQAHAVVRQKARAQRGFRVADIDHQAGLRHLQRRQVGAGDLERDAAAVDAAHIAFGARDRDFVAGVE